MARHGRTTSPPKGPFPKLGLLVREISGNATTREIASVAPVSRSLAQKLVHGYWVDDDSLLIFAAAYNRSVNELREACGRAPFMIDPITKQAGLTVEHLRVLLPAPTIARFEALATKRGLIGEADVPGLTDPEQLVALLAELLEGGLDAQDRKD